MAHQVEQMSYVGEVPWHGIGSPLQEGETIERWQIAAGLDWSVKRSEVRYFADEHSSQLLHDSSSHVLFRSDNQKALGIVSNRYNVVQPKEILEFYRTLTDVAGMKLETAGSLREGKRIWALANTGDQMNIKGDVLKRYILLATSFDTTMATIAQHTSVRVVCNNTLQMSLGEGEKDAKSRVSISHMQKFDADTVKLALGLDLEWTSFKENIERLASTPIKQSQVLPFFAKVYYDVAPDKLNIKDGVTKSRFETFVSAYHRGPGANLTTAKDTAWGLVNAVTYIADFAARARSTESRLNSAWFGAGRRQKEAAFSEALKLAA